jgi:hypothetical protein
LRIAGKELWWGSPAIHLASTQSLGGDLWDQ